MGGFVPHFATLFWPSVKGVDSVGEGQSLSCHFPLTSPVPVNTKMVLRAGGTGNAEASKMQGWKMRVGQSAPNSRAGKCETSKYGQPKVLLTRRTCTVWIQGFFRIRHY